jgi:hypothetical protein
MAIEVRGQLYIDGQWASPLGTGTIDVINATGGGDRQRHRVRVGGGVWSGDRDRAIAMARRLQAGQVEVNGGPFNPQAPFGGYKQSGNGRELGPFGLEEFLEVKSLQL